MPLAPSDLRAPQGQIEPSVFADIDLDTYLAGWAAQAEAQTESASAQEAYVYHLAFSWRAQKAAGENASEDVDGLVSTRRTDEQRRTWQKLADYWLATYRRRAAETGEEPEGATQPADWKPVLSRR